MNFTSKKDAENWLLGQNIPIGIKEMLVPQNSPITENIEQQYFHTCYGCKIIWSGTYNDSCIQCGIGPLTDLPTLVEKLKELQYKREAAIQKIWHETNEMKNEK